LLDCEHFTPVTWITAAFMAHLCDERTLTKKLETHRPESSTQQRKIHPMDFERGNSTAPKAIIESNQSEMLEDRH